MATKKNIKEAVELLLKHPKIDVNAQNNEGHTPFIIAAAYNHKEIVKSLLKHPDIDVNVRCENGGTALMYAAAWGKNEAVELLVKHPKIDVNMGISSFVEGNTILSMAMQEGHKEIVKMLLKHPDIDVNAVCNMFGVTALGRAILRDDKDMIKLLLRHSDINVKGNPIFSNLMVAIVRGREEIVKLFLDKGADVNEKLPIIESTPLISAVIFERPRIVNLLLSQPGIDVNARNGEGQTALDIAVESEYRGMARLIRSKMGPHGQQIDPFRKRVKYTTIKKINEKFLSAVSHEDIDKINILLDEENEDGTISVDVNARNKNEDTAMIIASENGNLKAVGSLLFYDADLSLKGANGDNALIRAAQKGCFDVVEKLLHHRVNINSTNDFNRTALMEAAENGYLRVVKLLLKKGAKPSIKDNFGKTALDLVKAKIRKLSKARNADCENIKELLEKQIKPSNLTNIELRIPESSSNNWEVIADKDFEKDLKGWEKNDRNIHEKIQYLVRMIKFDPFRVFGGVEPLTGDLKGLYSRRIDKQNRLVYEIDGEKVILKSCKGHYEKDKRSRL